MKVRIIAIVCLLSLLIVGVANGEERRPSISETKASIERALDKLVPKSENLDRFNILVGYRLDEEYSYVSEITCYSPRSAEINYDDAMILMVWQKLGDNGIAGIIAHELAHCSIKNLKIKPGHKKEFDADLTGFDYYYRSGYDTQHYLDTYKLRQDAWGDNASVSHPSDSRRITKIKEYAKNKYNIILK